MGQCDEFACYMTQDVARQWRCTVSLCSLSHHVKQTQPFLIAIFWKYYHLLIWFLKRKLKSIVSVISFFRSKSCPKKKKIVKKMLYSPIFLQIPDCISLNQPIFFSFPNLKYFHFLFIPHSLFPFPRPHVIHTIWKCSSIHPCAMNFKADSFFFCLINIHLCITPCSETAHLHSISAISSSACASADLQRREWTAATYEILNWEQSPYACVGWCVCNYVSVSCVSAPHRTSEPPPLCVIAVMSADCRLLWCLHLSSIWPMLVIWPGLIVLMVTPASCPRVGRPSSSPGIMKEM